jgi:putative spermidine/putrescine transport system ATP-binding protein
MHGKMTHGAPVVFQGVGKTYGPLTALHQTTLGVEAGEFFALLGPSGSGKSTLLGTVAGFVPPSRGRVLIGDVDITSVPPHRRNIGMVFQNYALFPYLTVFGNIAFPLQMRRLPRTEIDRRVRRILDVVRLPGLADRLPGQLSGGQQQRVALARAAVYDPPVLLMDEPLGALDKNLREEMQDEIRQFHRAIGATILYVTHDQQEAASMADRMAIMNHGRLEQVGPPRALYDLPCNAFVASFLGEANLFRIIDRDGNRLRTEPGLALAASGGPGAIACVRPEHLVITASPPGHANAFSGTVDDVVHGAGTIRYRVRLAPDCIVTIRAKPDRRAPDFTVGDRVGVGWDAEDTLILPDE